MAYTTETWVLHRDSNKATITFEITNFAAAVAAKEKGQAIGGSRFGVKVYPSGDAGATENKVSIFTWNYSDRKVAYDYSITVGDVKRSASNVMVKGESGRGWKGKMHSNYAPEHGCR